MTEYVINLDGFSLNQLLNGELLYFDLPDYPIDKITIIPTPNSAVRFEVGMKTYLQRYEFDINKNKIYYYDLFGCLRSQNDIVDISFVDENDLEDYINNDLKTAEQIYDDFHKQDNSKTPDPSNGVNHPSHYNQGGIEAWDVIDAFTKDLDGAEAFYAGNVIKYILRWNHKNGIEDLEKAKIYIDKIIEGRKEK